ncbi:MAG: LPS export ABC transporter periplasmic protein LptC [Planctomycetes bacterium]|nr:LPS export ABC transporter periplasmic protein LptC [Planctomycetota bacterium]
MSNLHRFLALALALEALAALGGETPKGPPKKLPAEETRFVKVPFYNPATGELEWLLLAAKVAPSPENPRVLVGTTVKIIGYRDGVPQTATAKKGTVNTDTRSATLEGDVVMELQEKKGRTVRVEADDLFWDNKNGTAWTKGPVRIARPGETLTGRGLRLWVTKVADEKAHEERTGEMVIEQRARAEMLTGADTGLFRDIARKGEDAQPIIVTCDGSLNASRSELSVTFRDNVRATHGEQTLTCRVLSLWLRPVPKPEGLTEKEKQESDVELDRVEAIGDVRLDDGRTVAVCDRLDWSREEGSTKLVGRPAEIRWDNGNRLVAGLIHRMGDGAEIVCSSTPEQPGDVYLLAQTIDRAAEPPGGRGPHHLRVADVADWPAFVAALAKQGTASAPSPGKRLWEQLPEETRTILLSTVAGSFLGDRRKRAIVGALNAILGKPGFYREADFTGVALPLEAAEMLKLDPKAMDEAQVRKLNRLLLEAAFPGQIAKGGEGKPQGAARP